MDVAAINGVELCYETFGHPSDPAVLLLAGVSSSMDWWDRDFCRALADGARYVIRYDQRDTGRSTSYPEDEELPYSFDDLATDAVALIAELDHSAAHLVGISMGGLIAQNVAVRYPERVRSLTLIASGLGAPGADDLPPMSARLQAELAGRGRREWTDVDSYVDDQVAGNRVFAGAGAHDDEAVRNIARSQWNRSPDVSRSRNHLRLAAGTPIRPRLGEIAAPTLVVNGAADELFPLKHAEALAAAIPGAELMTLSGMGHSMPPPSTWSRLIPALLRHTSDRSDDEAGRLARRAAASGEPPTAWFDRIYQARAEGRIDLPWDRSGPHQLLAGWLDGEEGRGRTAVVVGCGLGEDAEYLSGLGWNTTAFDVAPSAIRLAEQQHPGSSVKYRTASLFELPSGWERAFDLVVEIFTVQALPRNVRREATAAVSSLLAPGGRLVVISGIDGLWLTEPDSPPWPLTESEMQAFAQGGVSIVDISQSGTGDAACWRGVFSR